MEFSDGSVVALTVPFEGDSGNDTIMGTSGADTIEGQHGFDILVGGTGNDVYVYDLDDGYDIIRDEDTIAGNVDTLLLGSGIDVEDVTLV